MLSSSPQIDADKKENSGKQTKACAQKKKKMATAGSLKVQKLALKKMFQKFALYSATGFQMDKPYIARMEKPRRKKWPVQPPQFT